MSDVRYLYFVTTRHAHNIVTTLDELRCEVETVGVDWEREPGFVGVESFMHSVVRHGGAYAAYADVYVDRLEIDVSRLERATEVPSA